MVKIFFSKFNNNEINKRGWNSKEGKLYLDLINPLDGKSIDGLEKALKHGKFQFIGEIDAKNENEAWNRIQNINSGHELNNRSMMVGDVMIFNDRGCIVESVGFSELTKEQIELFAQLE